MEVGATVVFGDGQGELGSEGDALAESEPERMMGQQGGEEDEIQNWG